MTLIFTQLHGFCFVSQCSKEALLDSTRLYQRLQLFRSLRSCDPGLLTGQLRWKQKEAEPSVLEGDPPHRNNENSHSGFNRRGDAKISVGKESQQTFHSDHS